MTNKLKDWMRTASTKEQQELARRAKTSRPYLYVLSNQASNHAREARPSLAARIERATVVMRSRNPKLPLVLRTDLNTDCRNCEYAKTCAAAAKTAGR
jgi:hypothetical protein